MPRKPYVSTYFSPRKGAAEQVAGFIEHCTKSIDIAVYSLTHPDIEAALLRAHARGVKLRVLTDDLQSRSKWSADERLEAAGVPLRRDTQSGSMHHKFCIGDRKAVITGSFNWTKNADRKNAENFVIVRLRKTTATFKGEFDRIWELNA